MNSVEEVRNEDWDSTVSEVVDQEFELSAEIVLGTVSLVSVDVDVTIEDEGLVEEMYSPDDTGLDA